MSNNEWTDWYGDGECPVADDALVDIEFRGGPFNFGKSFAGNLRWGHRGNACDIIRYRLHQSEQQEPQPQPGDILTLAQALRIVADNLDAGRDGGYGLEISTEESDWITAQGHRVGLIVAKARVRHLRLAPPRPRTVTIDGEVFEVPEPLREQPKHGDEYWCTSRIMDEIRATVYSWHENNQDISRLRDQQIYATQADAEKRAAIERKIFGTTKDNGK